MPRSEARSYDDFAYNAAEKEKGNSGSLSPFTYLCTVLIIALLGLIVLYSSSYDKAIRLGLPHYHYFFQNLIGGLAGLFCGFIFRFIPLKALRKGYVVLFPVSLVLSVLAIIPETRFLSDYIFAPSLSMLAVPFIVSGMIGNADREKWTRIAAAAILSFLLIASSLLIGGIAWYLLLSLSLIAALRAKGMKAVPVVLLAATLFVVIIAVYILFPSLLSGIFAAGNSFFYERELAAARSAIAEGGVAGMGLGNGLYKLGVISSPEGILIFSSFAEELGYLGVLVLIFLLLFVSIIGGRTVSRAHMKGDSSSAAIVSGITLFIVLRAAVNMGYVSGLVPLPGVPLPFFSYGPADEFLSVCSAAVLYRLIYIMGRENEKK